MDFQLFDSCPVQCSAVDVQLIIQWRLEQKNKALNDCMCWAQSLARACVPDEWERVRVPAATEEVVDALVTRLARLLEPSNEMDDLSPCGTADMALMRLAASEALLRLARAHDPHIHPEVYLGLSLTMQVCLASCALPRHAKEQFTGGRISGPLQQSPEFPGVGRSNTFASSANTNGISS